MANLKEVEQIATAYCKVFDSPDGKVVFEDLMRRYYDTQMTGAKTSVERELGRRDVLWDIKQKLDYQHNQKGN